MAKCEFCERLKFRITYDKEHDDGRFREKYYVRLYSETERDLYKTGEWSDCGSTTYGKSPLNFCPECGQAVKWE